MDREYEEMKNIVTTQVCAQCGGELTIRTNPETGKLEVWCPYHPEHRGYVERETYTQSLRRGADIHPVIKSNIEEKMLLPGGYEVGTALALIKTRFPRADMDDPSAALFVMDCIRLDLDPLLGEIVPVTFKVTDKETQEVRRVVQPILTEDGWLSLAARACPERWVGPPRTYRLEDYLRTLEENKDKSLDEIKGLAKEIKLDACGDEEAYYWVAWGNIKVDDTVMETAPTYGWLTQKQYKKAKEARTPAGELPGNQARVRAIKRWVRETFPEAKSKMKELTSEWMARGKDIKEVQHIIEAEYHIVTESSKPESDDKIGAQGEVKPGQAKAEIAREAKIVAEEVKKQKQGATNLSSQKDKEPPKIEPSTEPEGFHIDLTWLQESQKALKWTDDTCKTFLVSKYKVSTQGTLAQVLQRLTREQAEEFVKEINKRLEKQIQLFS